MRLPSILAATLRTAFASTLLCAGLFAHAQSYPSQPVKIIVPFPPGGGMDLVARSMNDKLSASLGQPVIIDNRPGAGGIIGTEAAARAPADGYTLLVGNLGTHAINEAINPKLPYHARDFAPVAHIANVGYVVAVNPEVPAKTLQELIALAKAKPGTLTFGSGGVGSGPHMGGELLKARAGIDIVHVPYKGGGPLLNDLMGGHVQIVVGDLSTFLKPIQAGKLRALAVTAPVRNPHLPDVPSAAEAGLPDLVMYSWQGAFAPAGTPPAVVQKLNMEIVKALKDPQVRQRMDAGGFDIVGSTPAEFDALLKSELAKWTAIAKDAHVEAE